MTTARATVPPRHRTPALVLALALLAVVGAPVPAQGRAPGSTDAAKEAGTTAEATSTSAPPESRPPSGTVWVPPLDRLPDALGVLAPFDPPEHDWLPGHRGVDLAATTGEVVRSPAPGVVTFAGPVAGRDVLVVTHDDGLRTSLEPVSGSTARGARVAAGSVVGTVQATGGDGVHGGHCAAVCVHWGVRRGERYVDPLALLGDRAPIVLLPLG